MYVFRCAGFWTITSATTTARSSRWCEEGLLRRRRPSTPFRCRRSARPAVVPARTTSPRRTLPPLTPAVSAPAREGPALWPVIPATLPSRATTPPTGAIRWANSSRAARRPPTRAATSVPRHPPPPAAATSPIRLRPAAAEVLIRRLFCWPLCWTVSGLVWIRYYLFMFGWSLIRQSLLIAVLPVAMF